MYDITWLLRGAQSAVFYYASCSPYTRRRNRRRRAKEVEQDRLASEAVERNMPDVYRQPSPYRHNKFWEEDIRLGPDRSHRGKGKRGRSKQPAKRPDMTSAPPVDTLTDVDSTPSADVHMTEIKDPHNKAHSPKVAESAMDGVRNFMRSATESGKQKWNAYKQQRADEELWGHNYRSANQSSVGYDASSKASSIKYPPSAFGRIPTFSKLDESEESFFTKPRAPPINDLHPPIISTPELSRQANRWMMQPPPPPSVMGGFDACLTRTHSSHGDNASVQSLNTGGGSIRRSGSRLERQLSARIVTDKLRNGETVVGLARPPSSQLTEARSEMLEVPSSTPGLVSEHHMIATRRLSSRRSKRREPSTPGSDEEDDNIPHTPDSAVGMTIAQRDFARDYTRLDVPTTMRRPSSKASQRSRTSQHKQLPKVAPTAAAHAEDGYERDRESESESDEVGLGDAPERRWSVHF